MVTMAQAEAWLEQSGVRDLKCLSADRNGFFRRMSFACAGTKSL